MRSIHKYKEKTEQLTRELLENEELYRLAKAGAEKEFIDKLNSIGVNHDDRIVRDSREGVIERQHCLQEALYELARQEVVRMAKALTDYQIIYRLAILGTDEVFLSHLQDDDYDGDLISPRHARDMVIKRHDQIREYLRIAAEVKRSLAED